MHPDLQANPLAPRVGFAPLANGPLFYRVVGQGQPIIAVHGGPDFSHDYLLPDLDRLADTYRLVYYDQRGRGQSPGEAHNVSLASEIEDLEGLRQYLQLDSVAVLGHSWGAVLALAYAIRHPDRVSHLILMNSAPACYADNVLLRREIARRTAPFAGQMNALRASAQFQAGDPATVDAYYRIRFATTIKRPEHLERLDLGYSTFTAEGVKRSWAVEEKLYQETYYAEAFSLLPELARFSSPALVIHGDYDFVPVEIAARIAQALPRARYVLLPECGHFAYIEAPDAVRQAFADFFDEEG